MATPYSPADIATILRACKETGVTQLVIGELKATFNGYVEPAAPLSPIEQLAPLSGENDPWMTQEIPATSFPEDK